MSKIANTNSNLGIGGKRAFTLIEVVIVLTIIIILTSLVFVAVGGVIRTARASIEQQFLRAVGVAVTQFEQQHNFFPPLLDNRPLAPDGSPALAIEVPSGSAAGRLLLLSEQFRGGASEATLPPVTLMDRYLRYEIEADEPRWSNRALSAYLLGGLGRRVNGSNGPGSRPPNADGTFDLSGRPVGALLDAGVLLRRLVGARFDNDGTDVLVVDPGVINDRWGVPIRYYRWLPTLHVDPAVSGGSVPACVFPFPPTPFDAGSPDAVLANAPARAGEVRSYNVPPAVGDPAEETSLRNAKYAIVSAGPDGLFGDEPLATLRTRLGLLTTVTDREVRRLARRDNVREVGP